MIQREKIEKSLRKEIEKTLGQVKVNQVYEHYWREEKASLIPSVT